MTGHDPDRAGPAPASKPPMTSLPPNAADSRIAARLAAQGLYRVTLRVEDYSDLSATSRVVLIPGIIAESETDAAVQAVQSLVNSVEVETITREPEEPDA